MALFDLPKGSMILLLVSYSMAVLLINSSSATLENQLREKRSPAVFLAIPLNDLSVLLGGQGSRLGRQTPACPSGWTSRSGSCYQFVSTPMGYEDARKECARRQPGADLVVLDNMNENNLVTDMVANGDKPNWIGAQFTRSGLKFVKKQSSTFTNFDRYFGHSRIAGLTVCVAMWGPQHVQPGRWNIFAPCGMPLTFTCEFNPTAMTG